MVELLDDDCYVCVDCLMVIANDDVSGLDYFLSGQERDEREQEIRQGIADAAGYANGRPWAYFACGDSEKDREFSSQTCDCCGLQLAGSRHHCVILGNNT